MRCITGKRGGNVMNISELEYAAASLYDGGWRAADRDDLIEEYGMTESDADRICAKLSEYENDSKEA